jgi:hypothetical protein
MLVSKSCVQTLFIFSAGRNHKMNLQFQANQQDWPPQETTQSFAKIKAQ